MKCQGHIFYLSIMKCQVKVNTKILFKIQIKQIGQLFPFYFSAFELLNHPRELARQITLIDHGKTDFSCVLILQKVRQSVERILCFFIYRKRKKKGCECIFHSGIVSVLVSNRFSKPSCTC